MDLKKLISYKGLGPGGVTSSDDLQNSNVAYRIGLIKIRKIVKNGILNININKPKLFLNIRLFFCQKTPTSKNLNIAPWAKTL